MLFRRKKDLNRRALSLGRSQGRPSFRPRLEALEDRLSPAGTFTWVGGTTGMSSAWNVKANWIASADADVDYPGQNNSITENVVFDNKANFGCELESNVRVTGLKLASNFSSDLDVLGGKQLLVKDPGAGDLGFLLQGGRLVLNSGSSLVLDNLGTGTTGNKAVWSGGWVKNLTGAFGTVYVYNTRLTIQEDAKWLEANLVIGQNPAGTSADSWVDVGKVNSAVGLADHLQLKDNVNIDVKPKGKLTFWQDTSSSIQGGIRLFGSRESQIRNEGLVSRPVADIANHYLPIEAGLRNIADSAVVELKTNTRVWFMNGAQLLKGKYIKSPSARTKGDVETPAGGTGKIIIDGTGEAAGRYHVYFEGSVNLQGGGIDIVSAAGVFFTVHVTDWFGLGSTVDTVVTMNIDPTTSGNSDVFEVGGMAGLGGALNVIGDAPTGYTYDLVVAAGGVSAPFDGSDDRYNWSWEPYGPSYTITFV